MRARAAVGIHHCPKPDAPAWLSLRSATSRNKLTAPTTKEANPCQPPPTCRPASCPTSLWAPTITRVQKRFMTRCWARCILGRDGACGRRRRGPLERGPPVRAEAARACSHGEDPSTSSGRTEGGKPQGERKGGSAGRTERGQAEGERSRTFIAASPRRTCVISY